MHRSGSRRCRSVLRSLPVVVSVALGLPPDEVHANLIVNGDFELPVPSNGTGNGWTSSGSGVFWSAEGGNSDGSFVLNESGQLQSDPVIEQTVSDLAIGEVYRIQGERLSYASGFGNPAALAFAVLLDGEPILELDRGESNAGWEAFSIDFVATADTHTVAFAAERNGDDSSYRIDNVALVPEPSACALFLAALAGIGVLRSSPRRGGA